MSAQLSNRSEPRQIGHFIAGQHSPGATSIPSYNPANGAQIGAVSLASSNDVDRAVNAANAAFAQWSQTPPLKRARVMFRFKQLLERDMDKLAEMITLE